MDSSASRELVASHSFRRNPAEVIQNDLWAMMFVFVQLSIYLFPALTTRAYDVAIDRSTFGGLLNQGKTQNGENSFFPLGKHFRNRSKPELDPQRKGQFDSAKNEYDIDMGL